MQFILTKALARPSPPSQSNQKGSKLCAFSSNERMRRTEVVTIHCLGERLSTYLFIGRQQFGVVFPLQAIACSANDLARASPLAHAS
jgi:hypothetical protein